MRAIVLRLTLPVFALLLGAGVARPGARPEADRRLTRLAGPRREPRRPVRRPGRVTGVVDGGRGAQDVGAVGGVRPPAGSRSVRDARLRGGPTLETRRVRKCR